MTELGCPFRPSENVFRTPDNLTLSQFMLNGSSSARLKKNTFCIVDEKTGTSRTQDELRSRTSALASVLHSEFGIGEDDVVLICSPNHPDYLVVVWAVHKLGGIVTLSNPNYTEEELGYHIKLTKPSLMVVHSTSLPTAHAAAVSSNIVDDERIILLDRAGNGRPFITDCIKGARLVDSDFERLLEPGEAARKVALLCMSSGTTGHPKAVRLSHQGLIANILQMAAHIKAGNHGIRSGDVALAILPFFHVAGFVLSLHLFLHCGMSVVVMEKYNLLAMLKNIAGFRVNSLVLVPPQATALCKYPAINSWDLSSVRNVFIGAAPVSDEVQGLLYGIFPSAQVGQVYGLTEATCTVSMVSSSQLRGPLHSSGRVLPGIKTRVVKPNGSLAAPGEPGELYIKTPSTAIDYLDNHEATRETFIDDWIRTGDQVTITNDGELLVSDRIKDTIKVRGFQVAPAELEGCLLGHSDVAEACVIGVPHQYNGEVPVAFIVPTVAAQHRIKHENGSAQLRQSILQHVRDRKVAYKHLDDLEFVPSIPKTSSGKLLRRSLRDNRTSAFAKL